MKNWIEGWIFNVYGGKIVARGTTLAAGWLFAHLIPSAAAYFGVVVPFSQDQLTASLMAFSMWVFEEVKKRRMANPASPAVQTDAKAPGGDVSAVAVAATIATTPVAPA